MIARSAPRSSRYAPCVTPENPSAFADIVDVRSLDAAHARSLDAAIGDRDWAALPPRVERVAFRAPSGDLAGTRIGDPAAPRIVLVPGVTGSKEDFALMMPLLARAGFHVVSFDLAGQYQSAAAGPEHLSPPRAHYDLALFVDDLIAVLESGRAPAHLLGYSFAGTVAEAAAVARPDLVASLCLVTCPPLSGQVFRGVRVIGPLTGLATPPIGASLMVWGVRNNLNRVPPGRVAFTRERFAYTRRDSIRDVMALMLRTPDLDDRMRATGIPVFVIAGTHDLWRVDEHRAFARRLGARVAIYPAGHSPGETTPYELCRDLVAFYDGDAASA